MNSPNNTTGLAIAATATQFGVAPMSASADAGAQTGKCIGGNACKGFVKATKAARDERGSNSVG